MTEKERTIQRLRETISAIDDGKCKAVCLVAVDDEKTFRIMFAESYYSDLYLGVSRAARDLIKE